MDERTKCFLGGALAGAVALLGLAGLSGLAVAYGGLYNVAATEDHASLTRWAFDTTLHNSVERRADGLVPPPSPSLPASALAAGGEAYKSMCQHCHAGPGAQRSAWADGMRPRPPYLAEAASEWRPEELYWIVKHGVRMSGMPAFGPSHDEQRIWAIVAFVKALPAMTPEDYAAAGTDGGGHGH